MNTNVALSAASSAKSAHAALTAQKQLAGTGTTNTVNERARQASEDFEAVYLNTMFSQMFTSMEGEGPFGGDKAIGVWRSFLTDEYSKSFAKKGGIGIAPEVYRTLMTQQENRERDPAVPEIKS